MGRGKRRRLSIEEELAVNEFFEDKNIVPQKPDKKFKVKGFSARSEKQAELVSLIEEKEIVISAGPAGSGKAQPLYSKIYTPEGAVLMGDIKIGQKVCTPDGGVAKVDGIYPQGIKDYYRIYFSDNTTVDCCSEHL